MYVLIGLPAAGKTTLARALETERHALRLTPDEWMVPLFGASEPDGKRDVLEGRLLWLARRALLAGVSVVLDFGVWAKDERSALRSLAAQVAADCVLLHLPVDVVEQERRVRSRWAAAPESTFAVTAEELALFRRLFQVPDAAELAGSHLDPPPPGYETWEAWTAERWPTSSG